jgi:putative glycosyltransferase (TIGR04372 family)
MFRIINRTGKGRVTVLARKAYRLFLMALALPVVLLVRALRPLVCIRFGFLCSRRLGHFLGNVDLYLYKRDAGIYNRRRFDILYYYLPICNYQVKKMLERTRKLCICPFPDFMHALKRVNQLLPGGKAHTITELSSTIIEHYDKRSRMEPYLSFTPEEESRGRRELEKLGIPGGTSFVCFHARDKAYLDNTYPEYAWRYQDFRDSNIHNYLSAAEEVARRGYFGVRMGAVVKKALGSNNPRIIDYAVKARTEFLDIYMGAKCRFFICDACGTASIPAVFRRPIAWVNYVHLVLIPSGGAQDLFIPKKLWLKKEQRFLTLSEVLQSEIKNFCKTEQYERLGIKHIENTPEEIAALAIEMDERLKGTWQACEEDEELQRRFWSVFEASRSSMPKTWHGELLLRVGRDFLRNNPEFVK